jgi:hypothetical protein
VAAEPQPTPPRPARKVPFSLSTPAFLRSGLDAQTLGAILAALALLAMIAFSAQHLPDWTTLGPALAWVLLAWPTWNARFRTSAVATRSQLS